MKMRIKHAYGKPTTFGSTQPLLNRLRSLQIFTIQLIRSMPHDFGSNLPTSSALEARLVTIEAERAQAAGRAYVNMLPPR